MEKIVDIRSLGANIKRCREEKRMTAETLAEQTGISLSHIRNIESASTRASVDAIVHIANILDVSLDLLLADSLSGKSRKRARAVEYFYVLESCEDWEAKLVNKTAQTIVKELQHKRENGL